MQATVSHILVWLVSGGSVLPAFVALVTRSHWSAKVKQAVMVASAAVLGLAVYFVNYGFNVNVHDTPALLTAVGAVVATAQTAYHGLWKQGGWAAFLSQLTDNSTATAAENVVSPAVIPAGVVPVLPENNGGVDADEATPAVAPKRAAAVVAAPVAATVPEPSAAAEVIAPAPEPSPASPVAAPAVKAKPVNNGPSFG